MFLVDHDEPEVFERRKDGTARADDDARAGSGDPMPFVMSFAVAQMAVQHGNLVLDRREPVAEALDRLRRQRNLGNQHQRARSAVERVLHPLEIDLGFSASRHPEKEHWPRLRRVVDGRRSRR